MVNDAFAKNVVLFADSSVPIIGFAGILPIASISVPSEIPISSASLNSPVTEANHRPMNFAVVITGHKAPRPDEMYIHAAM